jgi:hypothetical protein
MCKAKVKTKVGHLARAAGYGTWQDIQQASSSVI